MCGRAAVAYQPNQPNNRASTSYPTPAIFYPNLSKPSEKDPHRNIQPILMDANAAWKQGDGVDFLPELSEIRQRIQVHGGVGLVLV